MNRENSVQQDKRGGLGESLRAILAAQDLQPFLGYEELEKQNNAGDERHGRVWGSEPAVG